jgi:hypothetical protein
METTLSLRQKVDNIISILKNDLPPSIKLEEEELVHEEGEEPEDNEEEYFNICVGEFITVNCFRLRYCINTLGAIGELVGLWYEYEDEYDRYCDDVVESIIDNLKEHKQYLHVLYDHEVKKNEALRVEIEEAKKNQVEQLNLLHKIFVHDECDEYKDIYSNNLLKLQEEGIELLRNVIEYNPSGTKVEELRKDFEKLSK